MGERPLITPTAIAAITRPITSKLIKNRAILIFSGTPLGPLLVLRAAFFQKLPEDRGIGADKAFPLPFDEIYR